MKKNFVAYFIVLTLLLFTSGNAFAEGKEPPNMKWTAGPNTVNVSTFAKLNLPEGYLFADGDDARALMEYLGNQATDQEVGIVVPADETQDWFLLFEFDQLGYVSDSDASELDSEEILNSIKDGTEESNEWRRENGIPELQIIDWDEGPHYDTKTHNLVWSILAESEGHKIINYNTRILGRTGVTSIVLVADPDQIASLKPELEKIINNFNYIYGKRYQDFTKGDKVAEYGLTALVAGGAGAAASKLGLFAKLLLIFKKVWVIILGGLAAGFNKIKERLLGKKDSMEFPERNEDSNIDA